MATATGRRITTEEATVKTATVEIKALIIGGKQVTLTVFRQLIEEPIIDEESGQLRGVPWGTVNYHSGVGCDDFKDKDHLHVVWQKGNELRRACVCPTNDIIRKPKDVRLSHDEAAREDEDYRVLRAQVPHVRKWERSLRFALRCWMADAALEGWQPQDWQTNRIASISFRHDQPSVRILMTHEVVRYWQAKASGDRVAEENVAAQLRRIARLWDWENGDAKSDIASSVESAFFAFLTATEEWEKRTAQYSSNYASLVALDQLFIAV